MLYVYNFSNHFPPMRTSIDTKETVRLNSSTVKVLYTAFSALEKVNIVRRHAQREHVSGPVRPKFLSDTSS